jgi:hypothetical protein
LEESLQEQCKAANKNYNEYLCGKFVNFVKDKEVLDAYVRSVAKPLDDVAKYILIEFAGLIVSCFELPAFKRKDTGNDKDDEMPGYIKNFIHENRFMIPELREAVFFANNDIKKDYGDWINKNNLLPEVKAEYEDIYDILAHYPSGQPYLRERITSLVFFAEIESPLESKLSLVFHFHLIIEFLCEYYFSIDT